jgi:hypothetical protein
MFNYIVNAMCLKSHNELQLRMEGVENSCTFYWYACFHSYPKHIGLNRMITALPAARPSSIIRKRSLGERKSLRYEHDNIYV